MAKDDNDTANEWRTFYADHGDAIEHAVKMLLVAINSAMPVETTNAVPTTRRIIENLEARIGAARWAIEQLEAHIKGGRWWIDMMEVLMTVDKQRVTRPNSGTATSR